MQGRQEERREEALVPLNRHLPGTGLASDQVWFAEMFGASTKVAVYWLTAADTVTIVGTYDTVSAANTAALAAKSGQLYPRVAINWWHADIATISVGPHRHPDATEDLPAWVDADPAY